MTHEPAVSGKQGGGAAGDVAVPLHHELRKGTEAAILREVGLQPDDLRRALGR